MMAEGETVILMLPAHEGEGVTPLGPAGHPARIVAIAPASVCGMALIDLPVLAPAQAAAAARLALADRLALEAEAVHLVVAQGEGPRPACWVAERKMRRWLALLDEAELKPDAIVPANGIAALLPGDPVRLMLATEPLVASRGLIWRDDPVVTAALVEGPVADLGDAETQDLLGRLAEAPPVDFLSGPFAPRVGWRSALPQLRQIAGLAAGVALLSALIPVAQAWSIHRAAERIETAARAAARVALPDAPDPMAALAQMRGGHFLAHYAVLTQVIESQAGTELAALSLSRDGALDARIRVGTGAPRAALLAALAAQGLSPRVIREQAEQGRLLLSLRLEGM